MIRRRIICACLAICAISGAVSFASAQSSETSQPGAPAPAAEGAVARAKFSVFASGRALAVSPAVSKDLFGRLPSDLALDPHLSRLARQDSRTAAYVLAGAGTICLSHMNPNGDSGGIGCTNDPQALADGQHPLASYDVVDDGFRIASLQPDGTHDLAVTSVSGAVTPMSLVNNVGVAIIAEAPASLGWTQSDGSRRTLSMQG